MEKTNAQAFLHFCIVYWKQWNGLTEWFDFSIEIGQNSGMMGT